MGEAFVLDRRRRLLVFLRGSGGEATGTAGGIDEGGAWDSPSEVEVSDSHFMTFWNFLGPKSTPDKNVLEFSGQATVTAGGIDESGASEVEVSESHFMISWNFMGKSAPGKNVLELSKRKRGSEKSKSYPISVMVQLSASLLVCRWLLGNFRWHYIYTNNQGRRADAWL
jgi:hypothetical protein